jgi:L-ascorbate metabolism protein UlaG (beta-lactamase superfamily)
MPLTRAQRQGKRYVNPVPTNVGGLSLMFKVGPRILFGGAARTPSRTPGPFRTDRCTYDTSPASGLRITWFGHASSLVEIDGVTLLIDPVWEERAAPTQWAGPKRFFPPTLALDELPPIDAVIISHDHYDHLGAITIQRLARMESLRKTRWITALSVGAILSSLGVAPARTTELDWTEQVEIGPLTITALPTRHFSGRSLFNRFETLWASFALIGPKHRVYYGADSGEWYGFREIGERFGPFDLTMLEIGASDPLWREIHMGPGGRCAELSGTRRSWPADADSLGALRSGPSSVAAADRMACRGRRFEDVVSDTRSADGSDSRRRGAVGLVAVSGVGRRKRESPSHPVRRALKPL